MSRSGYSEDYDYLDLYRGQVANAIRGRRGQRFLRELAEALDALPEKRLIANDLVAGAEVCAIGALGVKRGVDMTNLDPEDAETVAATFNIAHQLAREVVWENDENSRVWVPEQRTSRAETPEERWIRMRNWVASQITKGHP